MAKQSNPTHYRELKSYPFDEELPPDEFNAFFVKEILPRINIKGYKRQEKRHIAIRCIHQLILTGLTNACIADSRRRTEKGADIRVQVWDAIVDAGLATVCKGSEMSRKVTRYRATTSLLDIRNYWELHQLQNLTLARNTECEEPTRLALIYMHTGSIDPTTHKLRDPEDRKRLVSLRDEIARNAQPGPDGEPDPRAVANGLAAFQEIEDTIERINVVNTSLRFRRPLLYIRICILYAGLRTPENPWVLLWVLFVSVWILHPSFSPQVTQPTCVATKIAH